MGIDLGKERFKRKQGVKMEIEGQDVWVNSFTGEEMIAIYVGMKYYKEMGEQMLKEDYPPFKRLTKVEREEYESDKKLVGFSESVINKVQKTLNAIGIDVTQ
jgi:hypothetical protein